MARDHVNAESRYCRGCNSLVTCISRLAGSGNSVTPVVALICPRCSTLLGFVASEASHRASVLPPRMPSSERWRPSA